MPGIYTLVVALCCGQDAALRGRRTLAPNLPARTPSPLGRQLGRVGRTDYGNGGCRKNERRRAAAVPLLLM